MTNSMYKTLSTYQTSHDEEAEVLNFDFFYEDPSTDPSNDLSTTSEPEYVSDALDFLNEYYDNYNTINSTSDNAASNLENGSGIDEDSWSSTDSSKGSPSPTDNSDNSESFLGGEDFDSDSWNSTTGDNTTDDSDLGSGAEDFDSASWNSAIGYDFLDNTSFLPPSGIDANVVSTPPDSIYIPPRGPTEPCVSFGQYCPVAMPVNQKRNPVASFSSVRVPGLLREVRTDAGSYGPSCNGVRTGMLSHNNSRFPPQEPHDHKAAYRKLKTQQWRLKRLNRRFGGLKYPCRREGALKRKRENGRFAGFDFTKHHVVAR